MWFLPDVTKKRVTEQEIIDNSWKKTIEFNSEQFRTTADGLITWPKNFDRMKYGI